jgi:glycosyltransferase involved in cell wall biosynthesis
MQDTPLGDLDIAIAHKDYDVAGGGEILAERLGETFDATVYTGFVNDRNRPSGLSADVRGLWNDGLTNRLLERGGITRALLYMYLWEHVPELHQQDVVIQSGNEPLWYVPLETQTTIAYTHSTPRLMYDMAPRLDNQPSSRRGWIKHLLGRWLTRSQREKYHHITNYPDHYIANSELVARRIKTYWNIPDEQISVVYPPTAVDEYGPQHADPHSDKFYLSINRLDTWKRTSEIIDAFHDLDADLRIAGRGPAKPNLKRQADGMDNVRFLGYVSDNEKKRLLANAAAVIYNPLNEDFGMVPIETLASGTPLVSVNDGFQRWQLTDGQTAVMYDCELQNPAVTIRNLRAAVRRFEHDGVTLDSDELQAAAEPYRVDRFQREIREIVTAVVNETLPARADWNTPTFEQAAGVERAVADGGNDDD